MTDAQAIEAANELLKASGIINWQHLALNHADDFARKIIELLSRPKYPEYEPKNVMPE